VLMKHDQNVDFDHYGIKSRSDDISLDSVHLDTIKNSMANSDRYGRVCSSHDLAVEVGNGWWWYHPGHSILLASYSRPRCHHLVDIIPIGSLYLLPSTPTTSCQRRDRL
jgi:hypothetical protein